MQKIATIPISKEGQDIAQVLENQLGARRILRSDVDKEWKNYDAFVFIGAMGICVRTIAPLVEDKHADPAVVCVDSSGQHAISVLSGHIGGANDLTRQVAAILGAQSVITTQSDNAHLWALDTLGQQFRRRVANGDRLNPCIFAFVDRKPTALLLEVHDRGTEYLEKTLPPHVTLIHDIAEADPERFRLLIMVTPFRREVPPKILCLHFVPMVGTIGFGLAHHPEDYQLIYDQINEALATQGLMPCARRYCTIDVKADEPFVEELKEQHHQEVVFYTAEELRTVDVPHPSDVVARHVGTPSVCEAAAILGSNHGELVVGKVKGEHFTAALAIDRQYFRQRHGHVEIVGAGPGDPDLVSVRGRRMLEQADLILYAGSLVPRELTTCAKPTAVVRSSASMSLEEQCALMKEAYDRGALIVRLHTGDPCIFGAIQEQMAFFDAHGMSYHITPGISSFLAAAAELRSQFTIPERTQTIILTRGEGRTPMPEHDVHLPERRHRR